MAIGDHLSFRIVEDEEDPKPLLVTDSGDLEFPYIGRFPAVDKTCRQLARELKAELEKEYYYHATVIIAVDVMAKNRGRVYLVGPVRMPGPQESRATRYSLSAKRFFVPAASPTTPIKRTCASRGKALTTPSRS